VHETMTSKEIYTVPLLILNTAQLDAAPPEAAKIAVAAETNLWLKEIAYQLAVLNEHRSDTVFTCEADRDPRGG